MALKWDKSYNIKVYTVGGQENCKTQPTHQLNYMSLLPYHTGIMDNSHPPITKRTCTFTAMSILLMMSKQDPT